MKKILAILTVMSLLLCGCAMAETADEVLIPTHAVSMDNYGTEDCTLSATFETATAIDDNGNFTYTALLDDLYDAEKVLALKAGDKFIAFGEEIIVETVEVKDNEVFVNGEDGVIFCYADDADGMMFCMDYTECCSAEAMGPYTLPLANPVHLSTYMMDENGNFVLNEDGSDIKMQEQDLTPADARTFFTAHGNIEQADYLSGDGSANTVRVKDGQVVGIVINWSSDN